MRLFYSLPLHWWDNVSILCGHKVKEVPPSRRNSFRQQLLEKIISVRCVKYDYCYSSSKEAMKNEKNSSSSKQAKMRFKKQFKYKLQSISNYMQVIGHQRPRNANSIIKFKLFKRRFATWHENCPEQPVATDLRSRSGRSILWCFNEAWIIDGSHLGLPQKTAFGTAIRVGVGGHWLYTETCWQH